MSDQATFENYEILRRPDGSLWELGRGAMGVTYKAVDQNLECKVALKIINSTFLSSEEAVQRFYREARSAAQLRHPNIAAIYHLGKGEDGSPFYAMEFCEGPTVEALVAEKGPLDSAYAFEITLQVAKALAIAEEHHVVHRDLKPANLIVSQRGDEATVVKVIDFGLAKMGGDTSGWSSLSGAGFIGTAHFSSPEQIEGRPVDTRSDIYSLGATLFYMLAGKPLYEGSAARIISQHLTCQPPFDLLPPLPPGGLELMQSMLSKEQEQRPQGALALRQQIEAIKNGTPLKTVLPNPPPLPIGGQSKTAAPKTPTTPPAIPTLPQPPPVPVGLPSPLPGSNYHSRPIEAVEHTGPLTLMDLMKARGVLSPAEAIQLATSLAHAVDSNPEGTLILTKQAVTLHWDPSVDPATQREYLRHPLAEWPTFQIEAEKLSEAEQRALSSGGKDTTVSGKTIVPGMSGSGGSIGALAELIYEMVGGTPGRRFVPVARLSENQNMILQRAISTGAVIYEKAADLIAKLKSDSLDSHVVIPPNPSPVSPHESHTPALPRTLPATPTQPIPNPFPQPYVTTPMPDMGMAQRKRSGGIILVVVGVVFLVVVVGVIAAVAGWLKPDPPTPPVVDNNPVANDTPLSLTDNNQGLGNNRLPKIDPGKVSQLTNDPNKQAEDAFKKIRDAIANNKVKPNNIPPIQLPQNRNLLNEPNNNQPDPNANHQSQVRFTLVDDLGNNQASEDIVIYVNGQPLTGSKTRLHIDHNTPHDTLVVVCNNPGVFTISAKATTVFYGGPNGTFRSYGMGTSGSMNIRGGETLHFNIQNFTAQDYSTYNFAITAQ